MPKTKPNHEIPPSQLRWICDPKSLKVKSTNEVRATKEIIGQDRAVEIGYELPLQANGWTWWDDLAHGRRAEEQRDGKRVCPGDHRPPSACEAW